MAKHCITRHCAATVLFVAILGLGCRPQLTPGTTPNEAPPAPTPIATATTTGESTTPATSDLEEITTREVDLLQSTPTDIAVSSVFRNQTFQVEHLVDGNLETAWNSRRGDLVGAWIDVRIPGDSNVTAIELTAGYTRSDEQRDRFLENHRVIEVRVHRNAEVLGTFPLDPDERGIQRLELRATGGTYRIEFAQLREGTRQDFREVCVSELRVMGHGATAQAGARFPRHAVGALPESRSQTRAASLDRMALAADFRRLLSWFQSEWFALNEEHGNRRTACALGDDDEVATPQYRRRRRDFFSRLSALVERIDEPRSDRLRRDILRPASSWETFLHPDDHESILDAFQTVADYLGDDDLSCSWSRAATQLRIDLVVDELWSMNHGCEHIEMNYYGSDEAPPPQLLRDCGRAISAIELAERLAETWPGNPRQVIARAPSIAFPSFPEGSPRTAELWDDFISQVQGTALSCNTPTP